MQSERGSESRSVERKSNRGSSREWRRTRVEIKRKLTSREGGSGDCAVGQIAMEMEGKTELGTPSILRGYRREREVGKMRHVDHIDVAISDT